MPNKNAATLHITNIVRGSFGFLLEELQAQAQIVDSTLKEAVEETTDVLEAFAEPTEERFQSAIEVIDERVLATARDFFVVVNQAGATMRIVSGTKDKSFGAEAVSRAAERAVTIVVEDDRLNIDGTLTGMLPEAHQFEFRTALGEVIRGRVARNLTADKLSGYNRQIVGLPARANCTVKRLFRNGLLARESFTLNTIAPIAPAE